MHMGSVAKGHGCPNLILHQFLMQAQIGEDSSVRRAWAEEETRPRLPSCPSLRLQLTTQVEQFAWISFHLDLWLGCQRETTKGWRPKLLDWCPELCHSASICSFHSKSTPHTLVSAFYHCVAASEVEVKAGASAQGRADR